MTSNLLTHRHDESIDIYHFKRITRRAIDDFYTVAIPLFKNHVEKYQDTVPLFYVFDLSKSGMHLEL